VIRLLLVIIAAMIATTAVAKTHRDPAMRRQFMYDNPCPATGSTKGACPGWQVDHVVPLKCGGADAPANMQWLTIGDHKAKTKREAKSCRAKSARRR